MHNAKALFDKEVVSIREIHTLYLHLKDTIKLPNDLTDLLRSEWVYIVSAFDKLMHDLIKIGMLQSYGNARPKTSKFNQFPIRLNTLFLMNTATIPPSEYYFEQEIVEKHKQLSFQDPEKVLEALSLIWTEEHKWSKICIQLGLPEGDVRATVKSIVARRNQIVHEGDIDPVTSTKQVLSAVDTKFAVDYINELANKIYDLIK